jgi:DNA-binding CsgD family transcriptional regulator
MSANDLYGTRIPSEREQRVIHLVAQGMKNHEVARAIGTTKQVVKNYLRVIYDKLGFYNRVELALWHESRQAGPVSPDCDSVAPAETETGTPISTEIGTHIGTETGTEKRNVGRPN